VLAPEKAPTKGREGNDQDTRTTLSEWAGREKKGAKTPRKKATRCQRDRTLKRESWQAIGLVAYGKKQAPTRPEKRKNGTGRNQKTFRKGLQEKRTPRGQYEKLESHKKLNAEQERSGKGTTLSQT